MAGVDDRALEYRQMLVSLDKMIKPEELSRMKMFCKDYIGTKGRDQINSGIELWEKLEERKLLSKTNLTFMKTMLAGCLDGRLDVFDKIKDYETHNLNLENGTSGVRQPPATDELKKEIHFLTNNLGHDWKFFMRALGLSEAILDMCVESHPRNVREQIHTAFKEWMDPANGGKAEKKDLLRALKEIHRNDLHQKLSQGI